MRRAGLDYLDHVDLKRHLNWRAFEDWRASAGSRLVLLTAHGSRSHLELDFHPNDILLLGRETAGVPEDVHRAADASVRVPMRPGLRSLNIAVAAAIVLGEALRQTGAFPRPH
jgi:tRNA (cytidine/uridine-2'-O-)-methyltransferase